MNTHIGQDLMYRYTSYPHTNINYLGEYIKKMDHLPKPISERKKKAPNT